MSQAKLNDKKILTPKTAATILIADDDDSLRRVLEFQLREGGYEVLTAADGLAALELFTGAEVNCLITDLRMPGLSGLELIRRVSAIASETPVIVITAYGDVETAVEAMRAGAFDYVTKPFNREEILMTVEKALVFGQAISENRRLRRLVHDRFRLENVIGSSERMRRVLDLVERVAYSDVTVLITGESGTGKELIARGIHFSGSRAERPFVALNCAAIPETLIESELFGHKRGSFTGAIADSKGKFEEASGGTLFLDEVSAMPPGLQPKLLRVLQEQEIVRLGESMPRKVDVRIIAATNRDLQTMITDGAFREDLYFRLAVVPIGLPPLRERREDIPLLAEHFLKRACERHKLGELRMEREVFAALSAYSWPGNVRELENTVERMAVLTTGKTITVDDLPENVRQPPNYVANVLLELPPDGLSIEQVEREIIRQALEMHSGNQTRAARYLDITRSALIYRMQKYGLAPSSDAVHESGES
ncbi:MAG TPA: sigma-54 dependent transcriptional regulator [Pyrinomonadaceae bacterium]|jgi:two-component system NtrC family response regulator|nr:sigma-54 dependent transcriptional regulator [Pyrinomonadaceae bacterium]